MKLQLLGFIGIHFLRENSQVTHRRIRQTKVSARRRGIELASLADPRGNRETKQQDARSANRELPPSHFLALALAQTLARTIAHNLFSGSSITWETFLLWVTHLVLGNLLRFR